MAYSTYYLGHITVTPPLNDAEYEYLTAFAETTHVAEDASPYFVSDNPRAPRSVGPEGYVVLNPREDLPDVASPWVPSCKGRCLVIDEGFGEHRHASEWLQWLIDHFLRPGAVVAHSGNGEFAEFTFDHSLDAVVAAHRSDSGQLWLIRVDEHKVWEEVVWPGDSLY